MTAAGGEPAALGEFVDEYFARRQNLAVRRGCPILAERAEDDPQWENGPPVGVGLRQTVPAYLRNFLIRRSLVRGQAAEVMIYWTAFPGGERLLPAPAPEPGPRLDRRSTSWRRLLRKRRGTSSSQVPTHVTLGGRPASVRGARRSRGSGMRSGVLLHVARPEVGCVVGRTEPGDRIRVWIVDVDGRHLFFVAETKEGFNHPLRPPPSKPQLQRAGREISKIIHSIRFD